MNSWIGVDLDGTLAVYNGWKGHEHIGEPVIPMVDRVRTWLMEGKKIKIFTARLSQNAEDEIYQQQVRKTIHQWCLKHIGCTLEITNTKDFGMIELWDDRCVQVEKNTGRIIEIPPKIKTWGPVGRLLETDSKNSRLLFLKGMEGVAVAKWVDGDIELIWGWDYTGPATGYVEVVPPEDES